MTVQHQVAVARLRSDPRAYTNEIEVRQARVRELLEEHLGTCDLGGVSVEVNEIRSRKAAPGEESA